MSDLDDYESILMCLNVDEEHKVLVYINRITKTLYYIDPKESNETEMKNGEEMIPIFKEFVKNNRKDATKNQQWIETNFKTKTIIHNQQTGYHNCGVFAMKVS